MQPRALAYVSGVLACVATCTIASVAGCASEPALVPGVALDSGHDDGALDAADALDHLDARDTRDADPLPTHAPPPAGAIRIANLNVHRLFDAVCDSGSCGSGAYEEVETPALLSARGARIAAALASLRADVALVEEIETQACLDAIQAELPGADGATTAAFPYRVLGETNEIASVDVGVLSAFPITEVKRHRDELLTRPDGSTTSFARELLEVHLDVRGAHVVVFAAHFRSKSNDDPGRRLAEARAARVIVAAVAAADPSALVVLGGDLNDVPGSEPILALEAPEAPQGRPTLARTSAGLPDASIATYLYGGSGQALDHLFVATKVRSSSGAPTRLVSGSFEVAHDLHAFGLAGSDHAGIFADFSGF